MINTIINTIRKCMIATKNYKPSKQKKSLNSSEENRYHFIIHGGSNKERHWLMLRSLFKQFGGSVLREINE